MILNKFTLREECLVKFYVGHHYFHLNCGKTCRILETHPKYSGNIKTISSNFIFLISKVFHKSTYTLSIPAITTNNLESTEYCYQHFKFTLNAMKSSYNHKTSGTKKMPCQLMYGQYMLSSVKMERHGHQSHS
jgi:hypothetical protein